MLAPSPSVKSDDNVTTTDDVLDGKHEWELNPQYVQVSDQLLGAGGYGNVYLGTLLIGRHPVAVKIFRADVDVGESDFIQEVTTWRLFRHPNVLELTGACITVARPFMVSPVMENGDILNYLKTINPGANKIRLLWEAASGLWYLHSKGIVHADFKPTNLLVTADGHALVADFGFSKRYGDGISKGRGGTSSFLPPERIIEGWDTDDIVTEKGDIYAFGVTIFQVWTLRNPYGTLLQSGTEEEQAKLFEEIAYDEMRPDTFYQKNFPEADLLADMPDELQALMRQCWATKPEDRPQSFDQICDALEVLLKGTETEEDKFKQSMQPMVTAARNGGVDVQYALGSMFAGKIKGFPKDPALAIEFYELAAAKGHSDAQNELALYYYMGYPIAGILKNTKRAFELWGQAADKGHVDACHSLGHILMEGDEVQKDVRRALQLWMTAASGGDAHAKIDIGEMYLYGRGVEQNEEEARKWFRGVNYDGIASINTHSFSKTVALTSSDVKFVSKVPASVLCTMCKLAAVDPILDSCEKAHLFCRKCGTDLLFRNEPCPVSKTFWEITDYTDADDVQKILNILDVLCVKSPKCQWKGRYKLLVPHMLDCSHCSGEARLDVSDFYPQLQLGMSAFEVFMMQFGWDEEPAKNWQSRLPVADEVKNYESSYWWTTLIEGLIDEQRFTLLAPSFVFTFCAKGSIYDSMSNWANVVFFFRKPSDYNRKNPPSPKFVGTSVRFTGFAEVNGRAMMEKLLRFFGYTSDRLRNIKGAWATDWCVKDADYGFRENVVVSGRRALLEATMKIAANPEEHSHEIHVNLTDAEFIPEY